MCPEQPTRKRANSLLETAETDPDAVSAAALVEVMVRGTPPSRAIAAEAYLVVVAVRPDVAISVASDLHDLLDSTDVGVRTAAAGTISHLADDDPEPFRDSVEPLLSMLESPAEGGHEQAVLALLSLSRQFPHEVEPGFSALIDLLEGRTEPGERGRSGTGRGVEFAPATQDEDDLIRFAAAGTLLNVTTERPEIAVEAVPRLAPLLDDQNANVRATICELLGVVAEEHPSSVYPRLEKLTELLVSDPVHPVPWKAASTVATLADEYPEEFADAVADDADELTLFLDDPNTHIRGMGVAFLSYIAEYHPDAVEPASEKLRALLTDENPSIRANAARTLRAANVVAARDDILKMAKNDPNTDVRDVATAAARRLDHHEGERR